MHTSIGKGSIVPEIDAETLRRISRLAMVQVGETEKVASELSAILEYFSMLSTVPERQQPVLPTTDADEDSPGDQDEFMVRLIRENFPARSGTHLRVPVNK
ncbi:MAG: hypothetical protein QXP70_04065 [Methanomassiliicoccales archaeon]